jgi:hypothetical protein
MSATLGFYELLEPYFAFPLAASNLSGASLLALRNSSGGLGGTLPGASATLTRIVTELLDYLSVEELLTSVEENSIVYRGSAKFGGDGRASPSLPPAQTLTSPGGQELSWLDNMVAFRLTVPRRSPGVAFDTTGLSGPDLADLQALNTLLQNLEDAPGAQVSDVPGTDFRLELLIRTVRLTLPPDRFIPARVADDGWLEPDPNFKAVVFEFPRLAFVLAQRGAPGSLDVTLRSWDSPGFDDPGDVDTARFFTLTPPLFLHSSRRVGFGIERLVADFSDNVTPPEILEQFGIGDDFNGFWLPLIRVFVAPGRTTGLALSARGKDLLFDMDKGFSGELALDILNRGGKLDVTPLFFRPNAAAPIDFKRGDIVRNPDGSTAVSGGAVQIPGPGELHLSIRGSISPYTVVVKLDGTTLATAGVKRPKWLLAADASGVLSISVTDKDAKNSWLETIAVSHVAVPGPKPTAEPEFEIDFEEGAGNDPAFRIQIDPIESLGRNLVLRVTPHSPKPTLKMFTQEIPAKPDGLFRMVLTPGDAPAQFTATWVSLPDLLSPPPPKTDPTAQVAFVQAQQDLKLFFELEYPLKPLRSPARVVDNLLNLNEPALNLVGTAPNNLFEDRADIRKKVEDFIAATDGEIEVTGFASFEKDSKFPKDPELSLARAETLQLLIKRLLGASQREVKIKDSYSHDADESDEEHDSKTYRVAIARAVKKGITKQRNATAVLVEKPLTPVTEPPVEHPPEASEPDRPPLFRRIGFRTRFERNDPVLL